MVEIVCASESKIYVYAHPTTQVRNESDSASCPTRECYTLNEISLMYSFKSNTTLVLLPGIHLIESSTSLDIENLQNFEIIGYTGLNSTSEHSDVPVISCVNSQTFMINLRNISRLLLHGFKILRCSGNDTAFNELPKQCGEQTNLDASIKITCSSEILINKVYIYYSNGVGLLLLQVYNKVEILNSNFSNNTNNCILDFHESYTTGATTGNIYIIDLLIADSVFSYGVGRMPYTAGGLDIGLFDMTLKFKVHIHNITLDNTHYLADSLEIILHLSNEREQNIKSVLRIEKLKLFNSISNEKRILLNEEEFETPFCSHSGFHLGVNGDVITNIYDSTFTGPGSCVYLDSDGIQGYVYLNKTIFSDVHCQCGALTFRDVSNVTLQDTTVTNSSRTLRILSTNITLYGKCFFQNNIGTSWLSEGSNLLIGSDSTVKFENITCSNNRAQCIILKVDGSSITTFNNSTVLFRKNSGTAVLVLLRSNLEITGMTSRLVFDRNFGKKSGALSLYAGSKLEACSRLFTWHSDDLERRCRNTKVSIVFTNNHALEKGGGMFIDDSSYYSPQVGSEQYRTNPLQIHSSAANLKFFFINNTADTAGSAIYGGWFDYGLLNTEMFNFQGEEGDLSIVASNPVRVCMCVSSEPDCNITKHQVEMYPGTALKIDVVAVGISYGTVPSIVHAKFESTRNNQGTTLKEGQNIQLGYRYCSTLEYTIFSVNHNNIKELTLTVERVNTPDLDTLQTELQKNLLLYTEIGILNKQLSVMVKFKDCPPGFSINYTLKKCSCHPILLEYQIHDCNISTLNINKPSQKWINATFIHNLENDTGVIVNNHCPFDYCKQISTHIALNLEHPDDQCDFNRSGILCGACQTNFSHTLGTSKCKQCSSLWILLLVPAVATVGILLIIVMLSTNLIVSTGMLNGLILYANVIRANHTTFFHSNTVLSYFVAWLNLDLGIEMCFYNGLDAYIKTWLQFIFPMYIWSIMFILIALSRRYAFVVRLCGSNIVQVLATLFLLSYAKLIRTIIIIFQPTILVYPDGYTRTVWLYDGNVDYLKGKHIPLFIAALLVLLCLSIPYTVSLLFIQWLRKYNHYRILRWVGKLKPLFDAYTGPFKEKHCYWFGVLLLVRVTLYLVFSLNVSGDTSLNLMAISTATACILSYLVIVGGVYESLLANITDVSFMLNLSILTTGTHFYGYSQGISTASVAIAFSQFVLIVLYHVYLRITETRKGKQLNESLKSKIKQLLMSQTVLRRHFTPPVQTRSDISHLSIELKEPLLVDCDDTHK